MTLTKIKCIIDTKNITENMKKILKLLQTIFAKIVTFIYDYMVTYPVTKAIYKHFVKTRYPKHFPKAASQELSMIDIGTGTGTPLYSVLDNLEFKRILAIDINKGYLETAKKRFKDKAHVEVKYQDFLAYVDEGNTEKFDLVFFGFSFMLMPNKQKALEVARKILKPGGKVYTFLTLYHKKNKLVEFIKPKMRFLTSIDFGNIMYYDQFKKIIDAAGWEIAYEEKMGKDVSFMLKFFKIYMFELKYGNDETAALK